MVGSALERVCSADDLLQQQRQERQQLGYNKHHLQTTYPRPAAPQTSSHRPSRTTAFSKQQYTAGGGHQRAAAATGVVDNRLGEADVPAGRGGMSSAASSSGRLSHSNLDCFLEVTTPKVKPQTLRKSCLRDPSQKRCFDPEVTPFFNLGDLWDSFDEWSAYGAGVPLMLNGDENVVQYYVPYLSALQLYTLPSQRPHVGYRAPGAESDEGSEASSDGENERSMGSERSLRGQGFKASDSSSLCRSIGSDPRLECFPFVNGDDEDGEAWSYFETSPPYSRVPLVDKIADLSRDFEPECNPLRILRSIDLLPNSWFSVAWYPIYRIPTGPTLRDLAACFLTYHSLSTPIHGVSEGARQLLNRTGACSMPMSCPFDTSLLALRAFGLTSYKLRGALWTSNIERHQATLLQNSADVHLKQLGVQHPDYIFFTSRSNSRR
ncbi:hypothetical protein BDL97_01G083400 [Sphagnum fallax]|jgi:hypothetical protein|nr:hypothetical protein BDL97_01G083400 [Sphagnum fallax]